MFQRNGRLLYKRFAQYFVPTVLMSVALYMSMVIDGVIVGNMLGPEALAAVNLGAPLVTAYSVVFALFGMGGSVLAAFYKGKREHATANSVFTIALGCMALLSLLFIVLGTPLREELAVMLTGGHDVLKAQVLRFITPLVYGCPLLIMLPGIVYFIRTDGSPGLAAAALITANIVNLVGDILFIALMDDIAGASIATVTGYAVGCGLLGVYFRSKRRGLRLAVPQNPLPLTLSVIKSGAPAGLNMLFNLLKIFCINRMVIAIAGEAGMVAFSVCLSCWQLVSMFISGAAQTMMPMIGVLYGEGDITGIRFVFKRALTVLIASSLLLTALLECFPEELLRFFGISGQEFLDAGITAVRVFALSLVGMAFSALMLYYNQTIHRQGMATAIAAAEGVLVVVPVAWILSGFFGITGIWLAFVITEVLVACLIFCLTRKVCMRSHGRLTGLLMLPAPDPALAALDVTITNQADEAVSLSGMVIDFCRDKGLDSVTATRLGLAVEEMAVNTARHGGGLPGKNFIDISVALTDEEARITFRDDGKPFNPVEYTEGSASSPGPIAEEHTLTEKSLTAEKRKADFSSPSGLGLIRGLAHSLDYAYTLGFNTTTVIVKIPAQPSTS